MKKLLSLLGAIAITASSSTAVISCTSTTDNDIAINNQNNGYYNNSLVNILNAGLEKSKGIIMDNEYGTDQSLVNNQVYLQQASSIPGLDTADFSKDSSVGDLVNKYFGNTDYTNDNTNAGSHVNIGNTNGTNSGLDALISKIFSNNPVVRNTLLKIKNSLLGLFGLTKNSVSAEDLVSLLNTFYNLAVGGSEYPINAALTVAAGWLNSNVPDNIKKTIVPILYKVINGIQGIASNFLPSILNVNTGIIGTIRLFMTDVFNQNNLSKAIYEGQSISLPDFKKMDGTTNVTTDFTGETKVADIKLEDVKSELLASVDTILQTGWDLSGATQATDKTNKVEQCENDIAYMVGLAISNPDKTKITKTLGQAEIQKIVFEVLRMITIVNAEFSLLENTHNFIPTASTKLFDFDNATKVTFGTEKDPRVPKTNFEYINSLLGTTLGTSPMVHDEAINISYFISNLDFFIGGLRNKDDASGYRLQQILFFLLNDPSKSIIASTPEKPIPAPDNGTYSNKTSVLLDFIVNTGLKIGLNWANTNAKTNSTAAMLEPILNNLVSSPSAINGIETLVLKPILLGLSNGDDFGTIIDIAYGALNSLEKQFGDKLKPIQSILDQVMKIVNRLRINQEFRQETVHYLISGDLRSLFENTDLIPNEWMVKLFGTNKVNLTTLINLPIHNILSIANVPGFIGGMISQWGDEFTLLNIPELIHLLNTTFNSFDSNNPGSVANKYINTDKDGKTLWVSSLKSKNINSQAIYDTFLAFMGSDTSGKYVAGTTNIVSQLIHDAITVTPSSLSDPQQATLKNKMLIIPGAEITKLLASGLGDDTPVPDFPTIQLALENIVADLKMTGQFAYDSEGMVGSFLRLVLPTIDLADSSTPTPPDSKIKLDDSGIQSTSKTITITDSNYQVDLLKNGYSNFVTFITGLDKPADYTGFIYKTLQNDSVFSLTYDPSSIKYFKNKNGLIKSLTYKVKFLNEVTGMTNTYIFKISRNSNSDAFNIDSITTDKLD